MEIWKPIKGYEGYYEVSNLGRVKRLEGYDGGGHWVKEHLMKITPDKGDYPCVSLSREGIAKKVPIHRIMAEAFIPNPCNKPQVNHIDENKDNYDLSNLEWVTAKENMNYGTARARAAAHRDYKPIAEKVQRTIALNGGRDYSFACKPLLQFDVNWNLIKRWESAVSVKSAGMCYSSVRDAAKGRRKTAHKCYWRYEEEIKNKRT